MAACSTSSGTPPHQDSKVSSSIDAEYERVLGKTPGVIEELRGYLHDKEIECPGVVVVGNQSSGKSSVLEQLTRVPVPRDQNTCTRVPAIVALQTAPGDPCVKIATTGSFEDSSTVTIDLTQKGALMEVRGAIATAQQELIDKSQQSIADKPVHIRYVRPTGGHQRRWW